MAVRFGVSPIAWINDDMPELGAGTSLDTVFEDARAIGFSGIELGGRFSREAGVLRPQLAAFGLDLVGGWYSGSLLVQSAEAEIAGLGPHLELLEAMGSTVFIFAETSNAIHGDRARPLAATPRLDREGWARFGARVTQVADYIESRGLRFAYHHHLGTVVETAEDLEAFLEHTGDSAGLTLDTGHAVLGGIDPVGVIRDRPGRISHVHCKDVRQPEFDRLKARGGSFLDGVLDGMFTAPGDGRVDYDAVMRALAGIGYAGWIIVEAEQDPALADPRRYSELGLNTLRQAAASAGLVFGDAPR
jgi:inosose dehydratase